MDPVRLALAEELAGVQREMLARTGMHVGLAAARTVTVARTASRVGEGVRVVAGGTERSFLAPLPLRALYGVPRGSLEVLEACGLVTIGELQRVPKAALQAELGEAEGLRVWRRARGLDEPRSADTRRRVRRKGASAETAKGGARLPHSNGRRERRFAGRLALSGRMVGTMLRRLAF
jgi:DNA polymerase-4